MYHNVNTKRILAQNTFASNDTWTTGLNNNDLLVGPALTLIHISEPTRLLSISNAVFCFK